MLKERFKVVPAVHLLLMREDKVLLARRYNTGWMDGSYSVPAGHVEGDEKAVTALIRETKEEIGIDIAEADIQFAHVMHRHSPEGKINERIDLFFSVKKWTGEPHIAEPDKCDDLSWFPILELPASMVPYVRAGIAAYTQGEFYSEFGWD